MILLDLDNDILPVFIWDDRFIYFVQRHRIAFKQYNKTILTPHLLPHLKQRNPCNSLKYRGFLLLVAGVVLLGMQPRECHFGMLYGMKEIQMVLN